YMCAMLLSFGVASALLRRATTGRGGEVDVSLLMAALLLQNSSMVRIESSDGPVHDGLRARLAELRAAGRPYTEQATLTPQIRTPAMTNIYYRTYATRDAAIAVACGSPSLRRAFITALGLIDHALERPIADRESELKHYAQLRARVEAVVAGRTAAQWQPIFDAGGIPAPPVAAWRSLSATRFSIFGLRRSMETRSARRPCTPCSSSSSTSSTSPVT